MNGPIAQAVSLVAYANDFLYLNHPLSFNLSHSTAQFCEKIYFCDWIKRFFKYREKAISKDIEGWMEFLWKSGVKYLRLHYLSTPNPEFKDRLAAAFVGGGGRWLIEACYKDISDYWEARWVVGNSEARDNRIWLVNYLRIAKNYAQQDLEEKSLGEIQEVLHRSFSNTKRFSDKHGLNGFSNCFEKALSCFTSEDCLQQVYHKDILPKAFSNNKALKILCACQAGWVFGGMGSWNDMGFDGQEQTEYEKVSDELYSTVCTAIPIATNSLLKNEC